LQAAAAQILQVGNQNELMGWVIASTAAALWVKWLPVVSFL
jgi:hypothetical protein